MKRGPVGAGMSMPAIDEGQSLIRNWMGGTRTGEGRYASSLDVEDVVLSRDLVCAPHVSVIARERGKMGTNKAFHQSRR
jgi:hypothetical protein